MSSTSHPCDFCGQPEATCLADQWICDACYIAKGSCCAGDEEEGNCTKKKLDGAFRRAWPVWAGGSAFL